MWVICKRFAFALVIWMVLFQGVASGAIIYVTMNGMGNGTSWSAAFGNLHSAISSANAGDQIWIATGTYFPSVGQDWDSENGIEPEEKAFYINKNIAIYGGFQGIETQLNQRDISRFPVQLSGDIGIAGDSTDNAYHVVIIDGTSAAGNITNACILDGLEICEGAANGPFPNDLGGAIWINGKGSNREASPTIRNCRLHHNTSRGWAGAIMNDGSNGGKANTQIIQCIFENNDANFGGALYHFTNAGSGLLTIYQSTFHGNRAFSKGGAIRNFGVGSMLVVHNTIFWNNGDGIQTADANGTSQIYHCIYDDLSPNGSLNFPIGLSGSNNLDSDPTFISDNNLRLQMLSPAIDAANNSQLLTSEDLDQLPREVNTADIGVFENPYTPCQISLLLLPYYLYHGAYISASQDISVPNGFVFDSNTSLSAPEVLLMPGSTINSGVQVEIQPEGCPN